MDNFEMTKVAGAVLSALLLIFGAKEIIEMRTEHNAGKPGYTLPGAEPPAAEAKAGAKPPDTKSADANSAGKDAAGPDKKTAQAPNDAAKGAAATPPKAEGAAAVPQKADAAVPALGAGAGIAPLLAKANVDNGKAIFGKCRSCHVAESGKPSTVGPNLWGVANRPKGTLTSYVNYSEGMKSKGGNWTFDDLSTFLTNPKAFVAGTKMGFAGLPEASDRADVIAYLATLSDTPVPLPK